MSLPPVDRGGISGPPPAGSLRPAPGEVLVAQVVEALGNRRYRVAIEGRLLEAVSGVHLDLGEEVVARVRHPGPPLLLEIARASGDAGAGYAVLRGARGPDAALSADGLAGKIRALVAVLPPEAAEIFAPVVSARQAAVADVLAALTRAVERALAADPVLARLDGWIDRLSAIAAGHAGSPPVAASPADGLSAEETAALAADSGTSRARAFQEGLSPERAAFLLRALLGEEEVVLKARPWTRPARELAAALASSGAPEEAFVPFAAGDARGVLRISRRVGGRGRPPAETDPDALPAVGVLLDMSRLGVVAAMLTPRATSATGGALAVDFVAARAETAAALAAAAPELKVALAEVGWRATIQAAVSPRPAEVFCAGSGGDAPGGLDVVA